MVTLREAAKKFLLLVALFRGWSGVWQGLGLRATKKKNFFCGFTKLPSNKSTMLKTVAYRGVRAGIKALN